MGEIAKNFLDSEKLAKKKTKSSTGVSCLGIPAGFSDDFISKMLADFSLPTENISSEASKLLDNSFIGRKKIDGEYFFCWRDIAMEKFNHTALNDPRTSIFDCVMSGVEEFWEKHVPEAKRKEASRIKSYHGPRANLGIPGSSLTQFYEWYERNLKCGFKEYDINCSSESLKHCLSSNSSPESKTKKVKTIHISDDESVAEVEPLSASFPVEPPFPSFPVEPNFHVGLPFPVEPSPFAMGPMNEEYFSSNVLTNMDMVFSISEAETPGPESILSFQDTETPCQDILSPSTNTDKSDLTLYTQYLSF